MDTLPTDQPKGAPVKTVRPGLAWTLLVVVIAVALGVSYWYMRRPMVKNGTTSTATTPAATKIVDQGITWQSLAVIGDQQLFVANDPSATFGATVTYYRVGASASGDKLVLAVVPPEGPGQSSFVLLKQTADGTWFRYAHHSDNLQYALFYLDTKKVADSDTVLASLDLPAQVKVGAATLVSQDQAFLGDADQLKTMQSLAETLYGVLYQTKQTPSTPPRATTGDTLAIMLDDGRMVQYKVSIPFLRDDKSLNLTATTGALTGKYVDAGVGCGRASTSLIPTTVGDIANRTEVATAPDGTKVYTLADGTNPIVAEYYNDYKTTHSYPGSKETAVSLTDFLKDTPILLWQDGLGRWLILENDKYAPLAECGKPVVYLYPAQTTPVTVTVGAEITKSEPTYGGGWQGIAQPNGQIVVGGQTYPYLFWEGHGQGIYPDTSKVGTIVTQAALLPTLHQQLNDLGLTTREQADFLEFWQPRLPQTPFVRLTWLNTAAMNRVAPLTVTPAPTTTIRVFLDFAGLQTAYPIQAQKLTAVPRLGFTVVEWGGLLQ